MTCDRAEEESTGRAKAEKENRELQALVQEMQDDLDSDREVQTEYRQHSHHTREL